MNTTIVQEWWRPAFQDQALTLGEPPAGSAFPFRMLMLFTLILLLAPQEFFPALAPFRIAMLAAGIAVLSYLFDRFRTGRPMLPMNDVTWFTVLLVGWSLLLIPLSYWPMGSVTYFTGVYAKTLIIFWLLGSVIDTQSRLKQAAWTLSLVSVPIGLTSIKHFLSGVYMEQAADRIMGFESGLTSNPNDLALMLNLILPLTVALFLGSRRPLIRLSLAAIICINVFAIFTTYSRGGFLTLVVIFCLYMWHMRRRVERRWIYMVLFLGFLSLPFLPDSYHDRIGTIMNIQEDNTGSAQERMRDTLSATKYVLQHPLFGAGLGNNVLAMNEERGTTWREIHNVYLQYAVELGVPGLILFLLLFGSCFKLASRAQRHAAISQELRDVYFIAEGVRISLVAYAVAALFYPVAYHFYFYYMAGLAVAVWSVSNSAIMQGPSALSRGANVPGPVAQPVHIPERGR